MPIKDTKVTASPIVLVISGREMMASPLTDRQLEYLTNYVRFWMKKNAKEQSSFITDDKERYVFLEREDRKSINISWWEPAALTVLSTVEGTAVVAREMLKKDQPDLDLEWLKEQFGGTSKLTDLSLENTNAVRTAFLELCTLDTADEKPESPEQVAEVKKKKRA